MNTVEVTVHGDEYDSLVPGVEQASLLILDRLGIDGWEFSVFLCNDDIIRAMNKLYRNLDEPTDVLSFSQDGSINPDTGGVIAGDVVISYDTVKRHAEEQGIAPSEELLRMLVHGILHLTGMDHKDKESEDAMLRKQEEMVASIKGVGKV